MNAYRHPYPFSAIVGQDRRDHGDEPLMRLQAHVGQHAKHRVDLDPAHGGRPVRAGRWAASTLHETPPATPSPAHQAGSPSGGSGDSGS